MYLSVWLSYTRSDPQTLTQIVKHHALDTAFAIRIGMGEWLPGAKGGSWDGLSEFGGGGDGNILNQFVGRVASMCKFTKTHWTGDLKWVTFMGCKVYLNPAVKKKLKKYLAILRLGCVPESFFPALPRYNWHKAVLSLRCTMWWSVYISWTITMRGSVNTSSTSRDYNFVYVWWEHLRVLYSA